MKGDNINQGTSHGQCAERKLLTKDLEDCGYYYSSADYYTDCRLPWWSTVTKPHASIVQEKYCSCLISNDNFSMTPGLV